jgi:hypothetical protein
MKHIGRLTARSLSRIALLAALCGSLFLLLSACSSEQRIVLSGDGSGTAEVDVELDPLMVRYIKDVAAGFTAPSEPDGEAGKEGPFRAFDAARIREAFTRIQGARIERLELPGEGSLRLSASFRRVDELLPEHPAAEEAVPPLRFSSDGPRRTLRILINRSNYRAVYPLIGMDAQNAVASFGPQQDPYREGEYIEMMRYALGDYAGGREIEKALRGASTRLSLQVDGPILSAEGCTVSGRRATAEIPYLRFATLAEPIEIRITWRPEP